ncbi:MAG: HTH-type transcriptional regulator CysB, partial [Azoarcus sp.]|nr:HTH-type transcriptional regulator CysB [Azoarcus sp.]
MNLQQLRYIHEVARHGLNVSDAAESLFTSQPGVSKQIRQLESELGVEIFVRHGKRLAAVTEPGRAVLDIASRILGEIDNLQQVGAEFSAEDAGRLSIATTHTQARYALPTVIRDFMRRYPQVRLELHQGNPKQVCEMVLDGSADLAIATESIADYEELVTLPCRQWNRCVVAAPRHPVLREQPLTLEAIARYPLITYDDAFTGRGQINKAFLGRGLKPRIVLTAIDSDVIKTYVAMDLGIGILARMAYDPAVDRSLGMIEAAHLFESSTTRIGLRRRAWLRGYVYAFIEGFAPHLARKMVEMA